MSWYRLDALDTLFFRDGRPFAAGEAVEGYSVFPPTPLTVQGFVRSLVLSQSCGRWEEYSKGCEPCDRRISCDAKAAVGTQPGSNVANQPRLIVRGPWLLVNNKQLALRSPADLFCIEENLKIAERREIEEHPQIRAATLRPAGAASSNMPDKLQALLSPYEKSCAVSGWISWEAFLIYLRNPKDMFLTRGRDWWLEGDIARIEQRCGLEMDSGRNLAKRGQLYFPRHHRLEQNVALAIEVNGVGNIEKSGFPAFPGSPFGGERRAVSVEKMDSAPDTGNIPGDLEDAIRQCGHAKLVLAQPAWFADGWKPQGWSDGQAIVGSATVEWIAAQVDRPLRLGGWDLAHNRQKPMRTFVPAGSVFWLQADAPAIVEIIKIWNGALTETPSKGEPFQYSTLGLGQVFVGTW